MQVILYLCTVLIAVGAINVQTKIKVVEAPRGKSAILPCEYQSKVPDTSGVAVYWRKMPEETMALAYFANENNSDDVYKNRVSFTGSYKTGDATIQIDQLRMEDNGTYTCEVNVPGDFQGVRSAKMDLLVLVAPSKPICAIVGATEIGQVVKLTCISEEGSPVPDYSWKSFSLQDLERQLPQTAVIEKGELTLKNISMETTGFFICTSTNRIGRESCNITLGVTLPSMNIPLYAGVIGGSIAAIIIIGIIVYCCCCRDKEDREDYEMADREEEEEEADHQPQQKKQQQQQQQQQYYHQEDEEEEEEVYDDTEDNLPRKPPMPPSNKPRLVMNHADA